MRSVLVIPDVHLPFEDKRTLRAVEKYMSSRHWDECIYLGDLLDFSCVSSHNKNKPGITAGESVKKDYNYANKFLDRHQKILGPKTKITIIEGNHDYRIERWIEEFPAMKGSLEVEKGLRLRERGINWVRYWSTGKVYKIGKATYGHGRYVNDGHAKKHVQTYGTNFFYGHLHDIQGYSLTHAGDNKTIVGQSLGCVCNYRQYWLKGYPNRWNQAITTFFFRPNGFFNYYISSIFNHALIGPDGVLYQG